MTLAELLKNSNGQFGGAANPRAVRDDSAGDYGESLNPEAMSWPSWIKAKASDLGVGAGNLTSNLVGALSPIGTSAEGNMALQVPPMISGIADSYSRLAGTPSQPGNAYNLSGVPELDAPIQQDMSNVLLSLYGGNALNPLAKRPAGSVGAGVMREGAEAQPIKVYHGTATEQPIQKFEIGREPMAGARDQEAVWFTPSTDEAAHFAQVAAAKYGGNRGAVYPAEIDARSLRRISPGSDERLFRPHMTDENGPYQSYHSSAFADHINSAKADGYPGVIFERVNEGRGPQDQIAMWGDGTVKSPYTGETLFSDTGKPSIAGAALATAGEQPKGITAYHGSPHDFDKFSLDKIGTGEGAQAYGHGLYFADNEGVAKSYRDALGDYKDSVVWKGEQPPTPVQQSLLNRLGGADVRTGKAMDVPILQREVARMIRDAEHGMFPDEARATRYRDEYAELERIAPLIETKPPGKMYQVRINADPESFLDWDKPLSQQPESVRAALKAQADALQDNGGLGPRRGGKHIATHRFEIDSPASEAFLGMGDYLGGPDKATSALREAGIPGIRYLDGNSRGGAFKVDLETSRGPYRVDDPVTFSSREQAQQYADAKALEGFKTTVIDQGSRNYVVFDDSLIEILKKYGLAGGVVGAGAAQDQDNPSLSKLLGYNPQLPGTY